jgi:hypothetical protein
MKLTLIRDGGSYSHKVAGWCALFLGGPKRTSRVVLYGAMDGQSCAHPYRALLRIDRAVFVFLAIYAITSFEVQSKF